MSKKLIAYVLTILLFAFPFRWAYINDDGPIIQLLGFLITLAGFFTIIILFDRAREEKAHG